MLQNKFTCVLVDDEPDAIELLSSRLSLLYDNISIISTYYNWQEALNALRKTQFDLLFMDISMPGKTGINLLKLIPDLTCEIIFVTAHDNYALDAFNLSASGYVLKPVDDMELKHAVDTAIQRINNKRHAELVISITDKVSQLPEKITIPHANGFDYISYKDITFLESIGKTTKIVTTEGQIISSYGLNKFQFLVDNYSFFQTHRAFVVNLDHVLRYETSGIIIMKNNAEIPLSRSAKNDFMNIYL